MRDEQLTLTSRYGNAGKVGAPYQPGSDTSREAAVAIVGKIAEHLAISPTANGRATELRDLGLIVDSGRRRETRAGRAAVVWIAKPMETGR